MLNKRPTCSLPFAPTSAVFHAQSKLIFRSVPLVLLQLLPAPFSSSSSYDMSTKADTASIRHPALLKRPPHRPQPHTCIHTYKQTEYGMATKHPGNGRDPPPRALKAQTRKSQVHTEAACPASPSFVLLAIYLACHLPILHTPAPPCKSRFASSRIATQKQYNSCYHNYLNRRDRRGNADMRIETEKSRRSEQLLCGLYKACSFLPFCSVSAPRLRLSAVVRIIITRRSCGSSPWSVALPSICHVLCRMAHIRLADSGAST